MPKPPRSRGPQGRSDDPKARPPQKPHRDPRFVDEPPLSKPGHRVFGRVGSSSTQDRGRYEPLRKPKLSIQTTTLWEYPSQHYGEGMQGDKKYVGATPSYVIWNVIQRYTKPGDLVVDPMCGSGTTLDVAKDTERKARGFDLNPYRKDIERADARKLPLKAAEAQLVFIDPPYGDHIDYSDDPACIGKLSPFSDDFYEAMNRVLREAHRVLAKNGVIAVYVCDFFNKKEGFAPVGFAMFDGMAQLFQPIDTVAVVRHNRTLEQGNFHKAAEEQNFFLRGFNYLFLAKKL